MHYGVVWLKLVYYKYYRSVKENDEIYLMLFENYSIKPTFYPSFQLNTKKEEGSITNHLEAHFVQGSGPHHQLTRTVLGPGQHPTISIEGINRLDAGHSKSSSFSWQTQARNIDETCRYAFPLAFLVFNFVYWPYYLLT